MEKAVFETTESDVEDNTQLPEFLYGLFWDHAPEGIHIVKHANFVMGRIMERGTWEAMRWMLQIYSKDQLTSFLEKRGRRTLPPRELNYWALMSGISQDEREDWVTEARQRNRVWSARHAQQFYRL